MANREMYINYSNLKKKSSIWSLYIPIVMPICLCPSNWKKFWCLNLDRTRQNISKFLASGVLTYLIFILLALPTDYLVIGVPYITLDFIHCLLSAMNIALPCYCSGFCQIYKTLRALLFSCMWHRIFNHYY